MESVAQHQPQDEPVNPWNGQELALTLLIAAVVLLVIGFLTQLYASRISIPQYDCDVLSTYRHAQRVRDHAQTILGWAELPLVLSGACSTVALFRRPPEWGFFVAVLAGALACATVFWLVFSASLSLHVLCLG